MMDENKMIETVGEGAKAVSSITDLIHAVIGSRISRNQAKTNLSIAEKYAAFIRENPDLEIAFTEDNFVSVRARTPNELLERGLIRETNEIMIHQENLESIAGKALSMIPEETDPEKPVDFDWIMEFKEAAKNIGAEEMQFIWANILAGEYQKPGSVSLRTLDVIRNLSKEEALVFQKLCSFIIPSYNSPFILKDEAYFDEHNISYNDVLLMEECGLMTANPNIVYNVSVGKDETALAKCDQVIMSASAKGEYMTPFSINQYPLTVAGKELYQLIAEPISESVFLSFARIVKQKNNSLYNVYAYKIGTEMDGKYQTIGPDLLADV